MARPTQLWAPRDAEDLYDTRLPDAVSARVPMFQGDVFAGVALPGREPGFVMVTMHPCAMRAGPRLVERIQVAPVVEHAEIPFEDWPRRAYELMPLPMLDQGYPERHYACELAEVCPVPLDALPLTQRRATLSPDGVVALQQRLTYEHTRVAVAWDLLEAATAPLCAENELHEAWNERFVPDGLDPGALEARLEQEAEIFDNELTRERRLEDAATGYVIRFTLQEELRRGQLTRVRQAMHSLIKARERARRN